jgi:hypothetical protein
MVAAPPPGDDGREDRGAGEDDDTEPVPAAPPIAPEPGRSGVTRSGRRVDKWSAPRPDARPYRSSFIGMAGMAMVLFIILASGAVLPWWVIAALTVMWLAALVRAARWFVTHPTRVLLVPLLVLGLWLAFLMGGVLAFGWGS